MKEFFSRSRIQFYRLWKKLKDYVSTRGAYEKYRKFFFHELALLLLLFDIDNGGLALRGAEENFLFKDGVRFLLQGETD